MTKTSIELDAQEAEDFMAWRQHQDLFKTLLDAGVFGVSNGSAEIHFTSSGDIGSIDLHFRVFRKTIPTTMKVAEIKRVLQ
jgi:hypothetical protein